LASLAGDRQVICITHLAQVASRSDRHFVVDKTVKAGQALTTVATIDGEEVVGELVRMLGAPAGDDAATQHARELLAA
jgi:DNA repair protein RecN (Recombination protein N)